jgi:tetratricopeptide (TPR) repeat protein
LKESNDKEILERAKACFKRSEYKKAQALFAEIIESDHPGRDRAIQVDALFHLANIFHIGGEIGKAIKAFNKVLEIEPSHTDASISLSVLYNDIGKYESAKKVFEQANERVKHKSSDGLEDKHINKKFALKHYELGEMYMSYNRHEEALFEYNKATQLDPENLETRIKVAKAYAKKGYVAKAFDELRVLKNEHPNYYPARIALGVLYYGNGKILEAQSEWEKVLVRDKANREAAMYLNLSKTATETTL